MFGVIPKYLPGSFTLYHKPMTCPIIIWDRFIRKRLLKLLTAALKYAMIYASEPHIPVFGSIKTLMLGHRHCVAFIVSKVIHDPTKLVTLGIRRFVNNL
jgi:hypothetical protein